MGWSSPTSLIYGRHKGGLSKRQHRCICVQGAEPSSCSFGAFSLVRGLEAQAHYWPSSR